MVKQIKTKLKPTRNSLRLTQEQVAQTAGISLRAYQKYENGECLPRVDIALAIARTLNSSVEEQFSQRKDTTNGNEKQKI